MIRQHGVNVPYFLKNLFVIKEDGLSITVDFEDSAYATNSYSATQFQKALLSLTGNNSESTEDTDGDEKKDYLNINFDVDVTRSGFYEVNGQLVDLAGNGIDWDVQSAFLSPGTSTMQLKFEGRNISRHAVDGPYVLTNLSIFDATNNYLATFTEVETTDAYPASIFEGSRISGRVTKKYTGDGIAGALILVSGPTLTVDSTDGNGYFTIDGLDGGVFSVQAQATGYVDSDPAVVTLPPDTTINFVLRRDVSTDTTKYRSFTPDSIAIDKDNKGKLGKYVKRKADKVEVKLVITAPNSATGFTVKFSMPFTGVIYTDITKSIVLDSITNVKEKIVTTSVDNGETFQIDGFGHKGKQITTSVIWATLPKVTKVDYKLPAQYLVNQPRLPMPNRINVMFETFEQGGFSATLGLPVGLPRADSVKAYGWLVAPKYTDALKSMVDKTGAQSGPASNFGNYVGGKPVLKAQKSLPPAKFNNRLFGDLIALKLNIAASALGKTPGGFGELLYNDGSNALDGMMIRDIASLGDSMMSARSYAALFPSKSSYESSIGYANLASIVQLINSAFEAAMDTVSPEGFTTKLTVAGARTLASVPYLKANPSVAAARITPLDAPLSQTPDAYALLQNYPNPFNPTTTIQFDLPEEALVTLKVYNLLGQEVATLLEKTELDDGAQEITFDASLMASGVYFYRLVAEGLGDAEEGFAGKLFVSVKKMVLIK